MDSERKVSWLTEAPALAPSRNMSLSETIQSDLVTAMRNKESVRLGILRMVQTALKNKAIEKREALSEGEIQAVLRMLVKQGRDSAGQFRKGGREEMAQKEEVEVEIIKEYLSAPATQDDIREAVASAISETGAEGLKDMGKVMKATLSQLTEKTVDGKSVSTLVRETLQTE